MTSDQVLGKLIAHLDGQLKALKELAAMNSQHGRVLEQWGKDELPPRLEDVAWAARFLQRDRAHQALTDAAQTFDTFWRMRGIKADGSLAQFNAVLVLALGPDAPQFVAVGDGWELREVSNE